MNYRVIIITIIAIIVSTTKLISQDIKENYIEVTGKAQMLFAPDQIFVSVKLKESQLNDFWKIVAKMNIDKEKDIQMIEMSSVFQKYLLKKDAVNITTEFNITLKSVSELNQLFKEFEKYKITDIDITGTALSTIEQAIIEVQKKAAENAKISAKELALALDREIDKAIFIQSFDIYYQREYNTDLKRTAAMGAMEQSSSTDYLSQIDFKKIKLEGRVMVRFSLK
jgi:uncharacterized protein YggE